MQKIEIEMINNSFEVRDCVMELADRGFAVTVSAVSGIAKITATRPLDLSEQEEPTKH